MELAYMKVGDIKGPAPFPENDPGNRKHTIPVRAARHLVASDIDALTGRPKDERTHRCFSVRKRIDSASSHLHEAHKINAENTVTVTFFHMPRSGSETRYVTVTLTKARIVRYETFMPHITAPDPLNPGVMQAHEYEDIDFIYESINWQFYKHESDPSAGGNAKDASEILAAFAPDWVEEYAKAGALNVTGKLVDEVSAQMLEKYKAEHPDEFQK